MKTVEQYREAFLDHLNSKLFVKEPRNLYEPMRYILQLGGKRLRPILTLIATDLFDADYHKALNAAMAIEMFHNFSLVHDDIIYDVERLLYTKNGTPILLSSLAMQCWLKPINY